VPGKIITFEGGKKAFLEEEKYGVVRADGAFHGCAEAKVLVGIEGCGGQNDLTGADDLVCEVDELCMVIVRGVVVCIDFSLEKGPYAVHKVVADPRGAGRGETGERAQRGCDDDGLEVVLDVEELGGGEKELRGELVGLRGVGGWLANYRDIRGQSTQKTDYPRLVVGGDPCIPGILDRECSSPGIEDELTLAFLEIIGEKVV
jgi:hypothetical protein